ncbi:MAG: glycosyltransferase [Rhizomicrobium sp.]|jgi:cellulose synthase/poly-beta-1,6-N-acetylglucosamine synthase-like glycosyltransferase/peptidoglycan/xylan/chitin deacetylase (PgdA/CDA1 family)/spore germination protein YaaH
MADKPIFFDSTGRRAARVAFIAWALAVISVLFASGFVASLVVVPEMENINLRGRLTAIHMPELEKKAQAPGLLRFAARLAAEARARREEFAHRRLLSGQREVQTRTLASMLRPQSSRSLSIGFYANWQQDVGFPALKTALPHLDWVLPTWIALQGPQLTFKTFFNARVLDYIRRTKPNVAILPTVQNATAGKWDGAGLAHFLADFRNRKTLIDQITGFVGANKLQGATIDFEEVPDSGYRDLKSFLAELSAAFAPHGWIVVIASPFDDDTWPYAAFAKNVDYTLLMAYDEHDDHGPAGSIAGQVWYETTLDKRMKALSPRRTIIALGNYGYDWNGGQADAITFEDAVIAAHDSEADINFDDATNNPHFSYVEEDHTLHDIWFLDAATAFNEIHAADIYQPAGYALWRLGSEDPSTWFVMGRPWGASAPQNLHDIPTAEDVDFEGQGEILRVEADPTAGRRTFELDPQTGDINDENYAKLPTGYVIRQFGAKPHELALTFDDGPDAEWTPQILDILRDKHVRATFFIIGGNAEANPGLVQRELKEGHEVGNHTFTHPNLADTSGEAVALELNATQRLFEALTGRSMRLFRPPYLGDAEPSDVDELVPVEIAQNLGYITVGEHVDPVDWELPGVKVIVQRTLDEVNSTNPDVHGNIILFHDAGGDRSETIAALPTIIDKLRAQGYQFVLVSDLAGLSRDQAMPRLSPTMALLADRVVFLTLSTLGHTLYFCFLIAIWLGVVRLLFLAVLGLLNRPNELEQEAPPAEAAPFLVSVLIPAYNEEKVIAKTVERILDSDYRAVEIVVIDDGSQDNTSGVLRGRFDNDPRVSLVRIANGGKAKALNVGLTYAKGAIVVALDADTQFAHDTISRLVRWFTDPKVGAVAGNAKVGNRTNMITRWQALEYIVAQNLERRALAALGTLTVVPGAVGAWRRSALTEQGGFRSDTLAEDQDLTISLQKAGYRVRFDSSAVAYTEAPSTFRGLAKQRFRWAYGTLQCLWKYRDLTFNPRYGALGLVALPQVWLFQILLTALAPLADLLLFWQLFSQWIAYLQHGSEFSNADLVTVGIYYAVFTAVDLLAAILGFLMERREDWSLLWWLVLQRFGYRQLMYYVVVRAISTALKGPFVGWGKLERTGTVHAGHT